ncbi:MAG: hypothetical protein U0694_25665 [Anaerolineae bacterium]
MTFIRRLFLFLLTISIRLCLLAFMLVVLQYSTVPLGLQWSAIAMLVRDFQYDYVGWEVNALAVKAYATLYGLHPFMGEAERSQYVRDYMADLRQAQNIEAQIDRIYADPNVSDPQAESETLRRERDTLRADLRSRQPLVESIMEGQVAAVLTEHGFGLAGQLLPPISAHFTQVPNLLIVSPRDQIRFDVSINLQPMTVDQMDGVERRVEQDQNVSALIVPLGGLALYPSMVLETSDIPWALNTIAHEWLHHYLFFFPLGLSYDFAGEARIINETTARLFGEEVGQMVVQRYYPELYVEPAPVSASAPTTNDTINLALLPPLQPRFDFITELGKTRFYVDRMLEAGQVDEAEAYMEQRRALFVANGYGMRRLNQAYFAFYGGYQTATTGGASGGDPIGPAVRAIYDGSSSLLGFIETMREVTTRDQLLQTSAALNGN